MDQFFRVQPHPYTKNTLETQFCTILQLAWIKFNIWIREHPPPRCFETQLWEHIILLGNENPLRELPILWLPDIVTSC